METKKPRKPQQGKSMNAKAVARDVIARIRRGERVKMGEIVLAHGYAPSVANAPAIVTNTQSYKEEIELYTTRLEKHRLKVLAAMENKNLNEEQYRTLSDAQAKLTHDVQLLTGGKTENVGVEKDRQTLQAIVAAIQTE